MANKELLKWDLDKTLGILGLAVALTLILASPLIDNPMYAVVGALLLFVCGLYLYIRRNAELLSISSTETTKHSFCLFLSIVFFSALVFSILSLYLRPDPYVRPLSYFISIVVMAGILAVEIQFLPRSKSHVYFLLTKIMLIPLSLVWSQLSLFPTLIGDDPWVHQQFTQRILDVGFIPEGFGYSSLPVFHLLIGMTSLITDLDYKMAALISISSMQIICLLLFIFLIGRFIFDAKIGLLAALLLGISPHLIWWSVVTIPMTLAAVFIPIIIYLLFKVKQKKPIIAISLSLLLMATLILTHTIVSTCMAILLFAFWAGSQVVKKTYNIQITVATFGIATLFTVAMFAWWTYASGHITKLAELIEWGFHIDVWFVGAVIPQGIEEHMHEIPFHVTLFNSIGNYLFLAISLLGCLYMVSRELKNPYAFSLAIGGMTILGLIFLASVFPFDILTHRWYYFTQILLSIPLAVSLCLMFSHLKNQYTRTLSTGIFVSLLSFLMLMIPLANIDNPLFDHTSVRKAYTGSELEAVQTMSEFNYGKIGVDSGMVGHLTFLPQFSDRLFSIQENLYTKNFGDLKNSVLIIREEAFKGTVTVRGDSFVRLNYDPREVLSDEGFSRIYDSGSVTAFYYSSGDSDGTKN